MREEEEKGRKEIRRLLSKRDYCPRGNYNPVGRLTIHTEVLSA